MLRSSTPEQIERPALKFLHDDRHQDAVFTAWVARPFQRHGASLSFLHDALAPAQVYPVWNGTQHLCDF